MVDGPSPVSWPDPNGHAAAVFVDALIALGVQHVVLSPGSRSTPLVLACASRQALQLHPVLDERSAAFFALGIARASARPVVLLCTSGSAGGHYLPAVIEADQTGVPLVVITADRPPELHHCGAPQTVPQRTLFGERVRIMLEVGAPTPEVDPAYVQTLAVVAVQRAVGPHPGPVHLNWAFREPLWCNPSPTHAMPEPPKQLVQGGTRLHQKQLHALLTQWQGYGRGVIICGPQTPDPPADGSSSLATGALVRRLAARLGWPLLAEATSQARFGNDGNAGACVITTYDGLLREKQFAAAHQPECILRLGQAPTSKVLSQWLGASGDARSYMVQAHGQWTDSSHRASTLIHADVAMLCSDLLQCLDHMPDVSAQMQLRAAPWRKAWQEAESIAHACIQRACMGEATHATTPEWEGVIAHRVVQGLRSGEALHVASSMPIRDVDGFSLASSQDIAVYCSRGANGIDGTLSTALGEALGATTPLVLLTGDLAFLHDMAGLGIAAQLQHALRVVIVVINNRGGGIFGFLPIGQHPTAFEPYFRTAQEHVNIGALCAALGVSHQRVDNTEALVANMRSALNHTGICVLEIETDPQINQQHHHALWRTIQHALQPMKGIAHAP